MSQYKLSCPDCGHDAMRHAGENGTGICMGSVKCRCTISAASLYAAECERLADVNADLQASVHRYAGYADTHLAERDAARAEAQAFLRERNAAVDALSAARVALDADKETHNG